MYVLTVMDSDWSSCLLRISESGSQAFWFWCFFPEERRPCSIENAGNQHFSIQFHISIKEPEFPAAHCRQLLRRDGSSSPAPLSEILFPHLLKHSFIHFSNRRAQRAPHREKKSHFIHFHPITAEQATSDVSVPIESAAAPPDGHQWNSTARVVTLAERLCATVNK